MDPLNKFLTRFQVRERTGWSFNFIDQHLPRVKVGRKILIPTDALDRMLSGEVRDRVSEKEATDA